MSYQDRWSRRTVSAKHIGEDDVCNTLGIVALVCESKALSALCVGHASICRVGAVAAAACIERLGPAAVSDWASGWIKIHAMLSWKQHTTSSA